MPSGFSMSSSLAPQTWISSTEACTSDKQPLHVLDGKHLLAVLRVARADDVLADAGPGMLLEEAALLDAAGAAHQRQRPVDDVGRDPGPDLGVELGQPLLGDAGIGPQHAVGMGQRHGQRALVACALARFTAGFSGATSAASLSWRSPLNTAWRSDAVGGPAADLDLGHQLRLHPAHVAPHLGRRRLVERRRSQRGSPPAGATGPRPPRSRSPSRRGRHRRACPCRE